MRATPVASFIILALVWLSSSNVPILAGALMVTPVVQPTVVPVTELDETERGDGGFGSTGR